MGGSCSGRCPSRATRTARWAGAREYLERSLTALGFDRSLTRADLNVIAAALDGDFSTAA